LQWLSFHSKTHSNAFLVCQSKSFIQSVLLFGRKTDAEATGSTETLPSRSVLKCVVQAAATAAAAAAAATAAATMLF